MLKTYMKLTNEYFFIYLDWIPCPMKLVFKEINTAGIKVKGKFLFGLLYVTPIFYNLIKNSL
jgi:hypothetical protein